MLYSGRYCTVEADSALYWQVLPCGGRYCPVEAFLVAIPVLLRASYPVLRGLILRKGPYLGLAAWCTSRHVVCVGWELGHAGVFLRLACSLSACGLGCFRVCLYWQTEGRQEGWMGGLYYHCVFLNCV